MNHPNLPHPHDGDASRELSKPYITTELDIASFLVASGHKVLFAVPQGALVQFMFDPGVAGAVEEYFAGAALPVQEVFKAHRHLRTIVKQVKIHNGATSHVYQPRKY
jgi:hypothetical protein